MPPMHSRKSLEAMRRVDLQRLCKEYGVKANLRTEDLIDLLLHSQLPAPPRGTSAPRSPPRLQPTRRSASVRHSSRVSGPSRTSSIIVHDTDDEGDEDFEDMPVEEPPPPPLLVPPPRTRKAKELQVRLGKGKPVIAGGSGPRAITVSAGSSTARQTKSSKSMKPREPTIEEEPETLSATAALLNPDTEVPNRSQLFTNELLPEVAPPSQMGPPFVADQMDALMWQLSSIKSEFDALQGRLLEVTQSQKEILVELRNLRELPSIVLLLKDDVKRLREGSYPTSRPCTPQPRIEQHNSTILPKAKHLGPTTGLSSQSLPLPGRSPSTLGKRHRDSTSSIMDGVIEESERGRVSDSKLAKTVIRPDKKRAKLQMDNVEEVVKETTPGLLTGGEESSGTNVGPTFAVYSGSEAADLPPPMNRLPEIFLVDSPPGPTGQQRSRGSNVPTSSANASENQPFSFTFAPMTSTPQNPFMTNFPFPEPPQSPSPAGASLPTFSSRQQAQRTDIFKEFGFPSPVRSTRNYGALTDDEPGINPAALQGPSAKRTPSSNEVAASLGLTAHRTTSSEQSFEAPTIRRTMYGTELDGDSRFGDFGVEGVASGFWLSK